MRNCIQCDWDISGSMALVQFYNQDPHLEKNEYIIFCVSPFVNEDPIISLVTLRLLTLSILTIFSDSLYPSEYI